MTEILIIGVNHNDPFGRQLIHFVLSKKKYEGFAPDCIAVEWDEIIANAVMRQRNILFNLLSQQYSHSNANDLRLLADAIAYEVDSHIPDFPDLPVLWLDAGRSVERNVICNYANDRLRVYANHAALKDDSIDLPETRKRLLNIPNGTLLPTDRDQCFFDVIQRAIGSGKQRLICIVGAQHADIHSDGAFGSLLTNAGYDVTVIDITAMTEV